MKLRLACPFFFLTAVCVLLSGCGARGSTSGASAFSQTEQTVTQPSSAEAVISGQAVQEPVLEPDLEYISALASLNLGEKIPLLTVNGQPIYKNDVESEKLSNEKTVSNGMKQLEAMGIPEEEKDQYRASLTLKSEEQIIQGLIERQVQWQEAERRGITADVEATYQQLLDDDRTTRQAADNGDAQARTIQIEQDAFIEAMGYTSAEEYYRFVADNLQSAAKISELRRQVIAGFNEEQKQDEEAAYQAFVNRLVDEAEIVYMD